MIRRTPNFIATHKLVNAKGRTIELLMLSDGRYYRRRYVGRTPTKDPARIPADHKILFLQPKARMENFGGQPMRSCITRTVTCSSSSKARELCQPFDQKAKGSRFRNSKSRIKFVYD